MSKTPSLAALLYRAKSTMTNQLGASSPATDAIAAAIAGVSYGQYAYQDYLFKQLNPETADEQWLYLWANRFKVERLAFVFATGTVNFKLTQGVVNIPKGVIIKTAGNIEYQVTAATNSDSPVPVQAVESGEIGNLPAGVSLYLVTAVTGLNPDNIISNEIAAGAGLEGVEHWRERIVITYNDKQIVGKREDYEYWAVSAHQDIDYAWVLDNTPAAGHVTVYIGANAANPILNDEIRAAAQTRINDARLAGCHAFVRTPALKVVNATVSEVVDINMRTEILNALQQYITARAGSREVLRPAEIANVIQTITNEFTLVFPAESITLDDNEIHGLGGITWI